MGLQVESPLMGPTMTLKIELIRQGHESRLCLSGELRCGKIAELRREIERVGQPATLDLGELDVVDLEGVRFLTECVAGGIQVVNCSPYIREWMLQEKQTRQDET